MTYGKASGGMCTVQAVAKLVIMLLTAHLVTGVGFCRSNPGREKCTSTDAMTCHRGQRPQIVEAYYEGPTYSSLCGSNCTPTAQADPRQCLEQTGHHCVQRLTFTDLSELYKRCALNHYCDFKTIDKKLMSLPDNFSVQYFCIDESSLIDPCQFSESRRTSESFLLPLGSPGCQRHCDVTPVDTDTTIFFNYRFIQGFDEKNQPVNENKIQYSFVAEKSDLNQKWTISSSYYTDFERFYNVTKLEIQFSLQRPDVIRHLWVSFNETEVEISCRDFSETSDRSTKTNGKGAGASSFAPIELTSSPPIGTQSSGDEENDNGKTLIIIVVVLAAVLIAVVIAGVVIVMLLRKRRRGKSQSTVRTDNCESPHQQRPASLPPPDNCEYSECVLSEDTNPDAPPSRDPEAEPMMATPTGCDVGGDYVHLRNDVKAGSVGKMEKMESDNYDHMPGFGMGGEGDVYNMLQRERKRQEVVDNVYNTTSEG